MSEPATQAEEAEARAAASRAEASPDEETAREDPPILSLTLRPHRSLGRNGSGLVLGIAAFGLSLPLFGLIGTRAAWGLLPFLVLVLVALYLAFRRSYADARLTEDLRLWPDLITVVRREPGGAVRRWQAHPFWVQVRLHEDAVIESYLTLQGNGREIELGAFLSPGERVSLYHELSRALAEARSAAPPQFG